MSNKMTFRPLSLTLQEIEDNAINNFVQFAGALGIAESDEENRLLQFDQSNCSSSDISPLNLDRDKLNLLAQFLASQFYNPELMNFLSCLLQNIYQPLLNEESNRWSLRDWLGNVTSLSEGVTGLTFSAAFARALRGETVIKYAKEGSLSHEVFVAVYGTNSLRQLIPNFSFVYGGFSCSGPLSQGKDIFDYCAFSTGRPGLTYALYEAILPSQTYYDALAKATETEFYNWFLQLLLSLQLAQERIGFTHFDLHSKNVLIRQVPPSTIVYPLARGEITLHTNRVATIIDYGTASILYQNQHFGQLGVLIEYLGNVPSFPLYDAQRILLSSYEAARNSNNLPLLRAISQLFTYFSLENIENYYNLAYHYYWALPNRLENVNLYDLIDFLLSLNNQALGAQGKVLSCSASVCTSTYDISESTQLNQQVYPKDIFALYVDYQYLAEKGQDFYFLETIGNNRLRDYVNDYQRAVQKAKESIDALDGRRATLWPALLAYRQADRAGHILSQLYSLFPQLESKNIFPRQSLQDNSLSLLPFYYALVAASSNVELYDRSELNKPLQPNNPQDQVRRAGLERELRYLYELRQTPPLEGAP